MNVWEKSRPIGEVYAITFESPDTNTSGETLSAKLIDMETGSEIEVASFDGKRFGHTDQSK